MSKIGGIVQPINMYIVQFIARYIILFMGE